MTPAFRQVDLSTWPRHEHYRYYTESLKVAFNVTADIQVDKLLAYCHSHDRRFYPAWIALTTLAVNSMDNLRMFRGTDGTLCIWEQVVPNYTIFHTDDNTFSDCWSVYSDNFDTLYQTVAADMNRYKNCKGIKARADQPANFFCISCAPWLHFTSCVTYVTDGQPQFFPIITAGKYVKKDGKTLLPVSLTIAHAVCDGYHAGLLFQRMQEGIDALESSNE